MLNRASLSPALRWSARDLDLSWSVIAAVIGAVTIASVWPKHHPGLGVAQVACGLIACLALIVRRRHPVGVAVVAVSGALFSPMSIAAAILAIVNVAVTCRLRTYAMISAYAVAIAAIHGALYLAHVGFPFDQLTNVIVLLPVVGLGLFARAQRARADAEQRERVEQARASERRRIAREMHDVLAHRISIVSVHAGALEVHPDAPAEDVGKAAGVIRTSAHAALRELREIVSLLRSPADRGDEGELAAMRRPQPTLDDVPTLILESRQAGTTVDFDMRLARHEAIPDATGRTVYRVVQEGLTNARKHAPCAAVDVDISDDGEGELTVSVMSGPPARNGSHPGGRGADGALTLAPTPGTGTGLIGLGERVALAHGRLEHGPTADGGYALTATLPVAR
jgi:signal transduction histidine kinase